MQITTRSVSKLVFQKVVKDTSGYKEMRLVIERVLRQAHEQKINLLLTHK